MDEFRMVMEIGEGLREEFGAGIDAHPGSDTVEAGQVNRAFRVAVICILKAIVPREEDLPDMLTRTLRQVAENRLASDGVPSEMAVTLLDLEPSLGDSWYSYVALAPGSVIHDLLELKG
jgi:hypothetical protein